MPKIRVNYKSDLPPVAVKFKINGNIVDVPDHDFIIRFFVDGSPGTSFECAHKGDEYINCAKTADDTLTCYIDNHKFGCGRLCCEFIDLSADSRYRDKVFKTVTPSCLDVVLVDGVGDDNIEVLNIIFGYEINEIASITAEESEEDGGTNVITITETNGEEFSFGVKNGNKGIGFQSVAAHSPVDGAMDITLDNGDVMTVDLNHTHENMARLVAVDDESELPSTLESDTIYVVIESGAITKLIIAGVEFTSGS